MSHYGTFPQWVFGERVKLCPSCKMFATFSYHVALGPWCLENSVPCLENLGIQDAAVQQCGYSGRCCTAVRNIIKFSGRCCTAVRVFRTLLHSSAEYYKVFHETAAQQC